ncbi:MAG: insulinase family protein, partial [Candidatus Eremiobacteraeota bacterium]|nr:insulinase family protein [Candidatus Eremiobacteraeota bacterium]
MNYLTGSDEEAITGIAHAQEHMLFRGSNTLTASQFADTTAITGGTFNADTQNEMTQFFFEMPSTYLDIALNLERSRATGVLDAQKLWDQERGAITQEVTSDNSSATFRLFAKTVEHVFAGTPYADFGLGTVASFKQIQAPDLRAFYKRWYHPNNAIYVIAGNVDPQATIAKVRALFGNIPAAKLPARRPVHLQPLTPLTLHDNSSDPITVVFVAYRVPGYNDKDYFASEILNDVLNSQRGALFELEATGKALGTFAQSVTHPAAGLSLV